MKFEVESEKELYHLIEEIGGYPHHDYDLVPEGMFTGSHDFIHGHETSIKYKGQGIEEAKFYWEEDTLVADVEGDLEEATDKDQEVVDLLK